MLLPRKPITVGVWSPSDWFTLASAQRGIELLRDLGCQVVFGKNWAKKVADFMSGTVEERISDFRELYLDPQVDVIWATEGGYAATEVRSQVRELMMEKKIPKMLVGYSDVSVVGNTFISCGLKWVMGPNLCDLEGWSRESIELVFKAFESSLPLYKGGVGLLQGEAEGNLIASNLDSLIMSLGGKSDPLRQEGKMVLAIEEWRAEPSTISRQLDSILDHSSSSKIVGLILGRFSQLKEYSYPRWAKAETVPGICLEKMANRKMVIPIWSFEEFGHPSHGDYARGEVFRPLLSGSRVRLVVGEGVGSLEFLG